MKDEINQIKKEQSREINNMKLWKRKKLIWKGSGGERKREKYR
jgi:hypothetical protein